MEHKILNAVNEMTESAFQSLKEAQLIYSTHELFDMWLEYEGIMHYTDSILGVLKELGYLGGDANV